MKERILTAIIALIVFLPLVIYGHLPFTILVYVMATIGLMELLHMHGITKHKIPTILAAILLWIGLLQMDGNVISILKWSKTDIVMLFIVLLLTYMVFVKNKLHFNDVGFILLATLYVGMGFYFLIVMREQKGLNFLLYTLFIIWATDTGAYFVGRSIGRHKLWPDISPKKTIEGAIGGIVLALIVGVIFQLVYPFTYSYFYLLGVTLLIAIFGQIGDLVESAFKRHYGVKDAGKILPGHGGILDRLDSLIFVLPILHFIGFLS